MFKFYLPNQSSTHIFKKSFLPFSILIPILFENSKKKTVKGSGSGLPGGLHLVFWKFKIEKYEGFWGFVIWMYASSAISKKNVVKVLGRLWGANAVLVISK